MGQNKEKLVVIEKGKDRKGTLYKGGVDKIGVGLKVTVYRGEEEECMEKTSRTQCRQKEQLL